MANFSNTYESGILNWIFRGNSNTFTRPLNISVALCSGVPDDASQGHTLPELPNTGGYARANLGAPTDSIFTQISQAFGAFSSGNIDNVSAITFPTASANWGWVSGVAIVDSGVYGAGQVIMWGRLNTAREVLQNDVFQFGAGELDIYLG
jgi:hypothetical protein